jgi:hypothetical protein
MLARGLRGGMAGGQLLGPQCLASQYSPVCAPTKSGNLSGAQLCDSSRGISVAEVYVSYTQKDRDAALSMIEEIRRANLSVWHPGTIKSQANWGEQIRHELEAAKCMVFVWSNAAAPSEWLQQEINNAIKAWSCDRLVVATLDDAPLPVGLRDLSPISIRDVSGTKQLIKRVQAIVSVQATVSVPESAAAERAPAKTPVRRLAWIIGAIVFGGLVLVGMVQIGPELKWTDHGPSIGGYRPFERPITRAPREFLPPQEVALDYSRFAALTLSVFILGAAICWGVIWLSHSRSQRSANRAQGLAASISGPQVFVSYSYRDAPTVEQLKQFPAYLNRWDSQQARNEGVFAH